MWAVMFFGPLEHLTDLAGGLTPFDIRPKGYSHAVARAFLEAIGEQGRRYYANPELVIDTFYPPLYAGSRGLALWWLTMPGRLRERPVPLKVRYALIAVPILVASLVSTPQQKCIGWPEQKYINDAGEQGPELGAFVRHQTWAGLSAGVSELARRERLLL